MQNPTMNYPGEIEIKNIMPDTSAGSLAPALLASQNGGFGGMGGLGGILIGALLGGGLGGNGLWGRGGYGGPAAAAVATDVTLAPQFNALNTQLQGLQSQISGNNISNELDNIQTNLNTAFTANGTLVGSIGRDTIAAIGNLGTAIASGNFTTLQSINGLGRDVTAQANQNALQQLNSFNNLTTTTLQGFNETSRDNANAFNQVQMSLNAMAAQNAACCCELKSAIAADGAATRALINDLHVQDLQGQLNDAKLQISNTNQTIALENFISTRIPPTPAVVV